MKTPGAAAALPTDSAPAVRSAAAGGARVTLAALALAIALAVLALYAPAASFDFVLLDDNEYVTDNPHVAGGLSAANLRWALTAHHSGHWHPLTWLSLMLDCHWFGVTPGPMHLENAVLHAAGAALLFLALAAATGQPWRCAFVAALFALHPLRVESVAWVTTRKDVLSGLFLVLTLASYFAYARRPSGWRLARVSALFALGMSAKPTLAVLPFGLWLLDFWPLRRWRLDVPASWPRLLVEKLPLLAIAGAILRQTWAAQSAAGAFVPAELAPWWLRVGDAAWSYAGYLGSTLWPTRLAVFYPYRPASPAQAAIGGALLIGLSAAAWRVRHRRPYLLVGWLWFVGCMLPMIGLIRLGGQASADRYTYIPHLGLLWAASWWAADVLAERRVPRVVTQSAAIAVLVVCTLLSARQLAHWRDSVALFEHALAVTEGNYMAHNNLGVVLAAQGRLEEAAGHYFEAARINPTWPEALNNAGLALAWRGDMAGARRQFAAALQVRPNFDRAENNLATAYAHEGDFVSAERHYRRALAINPDYVDARFALADALERRGERSEAAQHYRLVLEQRPGWPPAQQRLERLAATGPE